MVAVWTGKGRGRDRGRDAGGKGTPGMELGHEVSSNLCGLLSPFCAPPYYYSAIVARGAARSL